MRQVITAGALFAAVLASVVIISVNSFGPKDTKRLAWIISVVNSGVMTAAGFYYLSFKLSIDAHFFSMIPQNIVHFNDRTDFTTLVCLWFALANLVDIVFGLFYYPKYLGVLTAYIHHSVFIWMMFAATTGNGLFMTVTPFAPAFCNVLIEEFPTFLLAVGSVVPSLRTDIGFGLSFFLLRIVYHIYFLIYAATIKVQTVELTIYILTLLLHLNWFYSWITKYGVRLLKSSGGGKRDKATKQV